MLLQMFGFVFALLIVGGLATLVAVADRQYARAAPYIGFTALFAGLGALSLSLLLALIGYQLFGPETGFVLGFYCGYAIGGLGGAVFGFTKALRRRNVNRPVHPII